MTDTPEITVYARPGCPFCARLGKDLARSGLEARWVDIWQDPKAASFVRSVAGGNETVPTVVVGNRYKVNPSARWVRSALAEIEEESPEAAEASGGRKGRGGVLRSLFGRG